MNTENVLFDRLSDLKVEVEALHATDELKKALRSKICQATGIHNFVPYKPGTMICEGCGIFAKVGAMYMKTGDPVYLKICEEKTNDDG